MDNFKNKIQEIKESLSEEDIISLLTVGLNGGEYHYGSNGEIIFSTSICHGGDSNKLYYYPDTKTFVCYTHCGAMDIFQLVQHNKNYSSFSEAYVYICNFFHIQIEPSYRGFVETKEKKLTGDWDILHRLKDFSSLKSSESSYEILPENLLSYYNNCCPEQWLKEGITYEAMKKYGIRLDIAGQKIIIPHRDKDGNLIGIRGRSFNPFELDKGMKYSPVWIGETCYNHSLGGNLYGLYEAKDAIRAASKVCIVESEKSAMLGFSYYGDNNFTVATCGSAGLSPAQIKMLVDLEVREIIFAYDKENDNDPESELTRSYEQKMLKIAQPLTTMFDVKVVFDYNGILKYKDSPFDNGKDVLEYLMKNKYKVASIEDDKLKGRKIW